MTVRQPFWKKKPAQSICQSNSENITHCSLATSSKLPSAARRRRPRIGSQLAADMIESCISGGQHLLGPRTCNAQNIRVVGLALPRLGPSNRWFIVNTPATRPTTVLLYRRFLRAIRVAFRTVQLSLVNGSGPSGFSVFFEYFYRVRALYFPIKHLFGTRLVFVIVYFLID